MRAFGKWSRLLAALVLTLLLPILAGKIAWSIGPSLSSFDPENAFAWLWVHHLGQLLATIGLMWLWSSGSLRHWGFNLNEARTSLKWFGWFTLFCTLGMLVFGIVPMVLYHHFPDLSFSLNPRNVAGALGFYYLLSGSGEEPLFRGFVMTVLLVCWTRELKVGKLVMPAAGLWATLIFMLAHINFTLFPFRITHFSPQQQLFCIGLGLYYALVFYRTRSLLCPVLAHGFSNGIIWTLIYAAIALANPHAAHTSLSAEATLNPDPPVSGQEVAVAYRVAGGPLAGAAQVSLHYGFDGWRQTTDTRMSAAGDGKWNLTLKLPVDARQLDFVFTDGTRWDNNGGRDWHIRTRNARGP
jgi:membrane protease YdiL (CAAX protease family)